MAGFAVGIAREADVVQVDEAISAESAGLVGAGEDEQAAAAGAVGQGRAGLAGGGALVAALVRTHEPAIAAQSAGVVDRRQDCRAFARRADGLLHARPAVGVALGDRTDSRGEVVVRSCRHARAVGTHECGVRVARAALERRAAGSAQSFARVALLLGGVRVVPDAAYAAGVVLEREEEIGDAGGAVPSLACAVRTLFTALLAEVVGSVSEEPCRCACRAAGVGFGQEERYCTLSANSGDVLADETARGACFTLAIHVHEVSSSIASRT